MSVQVPHSNQMMRSQKTEGSSESGRGVTLSGFYAPNTEALARIKDLDINQGPFTEIALHECEGWTFFVAASGPRAATVLKTGFFRRESHKFFEDLPMHLFASKATAVHRISLSQSSGFLSMAWLYSCDEPGV